MSGVAPTRGRLLASLGITLAVFAAYALTAPGRIDMIDGQWRFAVAENLLEVGRPIVRHPSLVRAGMHGLNHDVYAVYSAAGSIFAIPFVALGRAMGDPTHELRRFMFSLCSPLFGAMTAGLLYAFHRSLGVARRSALGWTLVSAFASLMWPIATSTFDNAQHAFWVLLAAYLGRQSAVRASVGYAALGGLAAGVLFNYQEAFGFIIPPLALVTLGPLGTSEERRASRNRFLTFGASSATGLAVWMFYNYIRFGTPLHSGKFDTELHHHPSVFYNPLVGVPSLLFSPGKSIFLYSPPVLLGFLGMRPFWRREPRLALAISVVSIVHLVFIGTLNCFAGDWAWGPRYLLVLLPLWSLTFPWIPTIAMRTSLKALVVALGLAVQLMALSVDHQRFFAEQRLEDFFWARDHWFYFKHSALIERPREILSNIRDGVPSEARFFAPGWDLRRVTACPFRMWQPEAGPTAMRAFSVYYLPRPWPFWMRTLPRWQQPFDPTRGTALLVVIGLLGVALTRSALPKESDEA